MKSQDEFYLGLHAQLVRYDPLGASSSGSRSLERDIKTLRSRVANEGLAFITKTLPKLGKALDSALVSGRFNIPCGFKRSTLNASIPAFMQESFNLVFDEDGSLLDVVPAMVVSHLRQVCYFAYKLELPYSVDQNSLVIENFVTTDEGLELLNDPLAIEIVSLAKIITRKVFHDFDHKDIRPRHGPGAVATGEKLDAKWKFSRLYSAIHQVYPYYHYYVVGGARELIDRLGWYRRLERHESGTSRVVLVPKDSRGPRLISCEPLEYQWIQQGLGRKLAQFLEWDSSHTKNHVNFTRQEINANLAKSSSATQRYATIDLKDASDRVSLELVRTIFKDCPALLRGLEACRSTGTLLPDGRVIQYRKYAPMGSALCFPVEAYIFWVVIVSAIVHATNLPLVNVESQVYVYGDDIVVPTKWALVSIQALQSVGLEVNMEKSCITGKFRESCGIEAFNGFDVTPSRLRTQWSNRVTDGSCLVSYNALANSLREKGYLGASTFIWKELERVYGIIPFGTVRSSFPCKVVASPLLAEVLNKPLLKWRVNKSYQSLEFNVKFLKSRTLTSRLDGWLRLTRNLVFPPFGDPSVVVVPRSTKIKRGWMRVA